MGREDGKGEGEASMEKLNENIEWEIKMGKKLWEGRMGNTNGKNIKPFPIFFLSPFQTLY